MTKFLKQEFIDLNNAIKWAKDPSDEEVAAAEAAGIDINKYVSGEDIEWTPEELEELEAARNPFGAPILPKGSNAPLSDHVDELQKYVDTLKNSLREVAKEKAWIPLKTDFSDSELDGSISGYKNMIGYIS